MESVKSSLYKSKPLANILDGYKFSQEVSNNDQPFDKLEQALLDAEKSNQESFEELDRHVKAQKNAFNAVMLQVRSPLFLALFLSFCGDIFVFGLRKEKELLSNLWLH